MAGVRLKRLRDECESLRTKLRKCDDEFFHEQLKLNAAIDYVTEQWKLEFNGLTRGLRQTQKRLSTQIAKYDQRIQSLRKDVSNPIFTQLETLITEDTTRIVLSYLVWCDMCERLSFHKTGCLSCQYQATDHDFEVEYACVGFTIVKENQLFFDHPNDHEFWNEVVNVTGEAPPMKYELYDSTWGPWAQLTIHAEWPEQYDSDGMKHEEEPNVWISVHGHTLGKEDEEEANDENHNDANDSNEGDENEGDEDEGDEDEEESEQIVKSTSV